MLQTFLATFEQLVRLVTCYKAEAGGGMSINTLLASMPVL